MSLSRRRFLFTSAAVVAASSLMPVSAKAMGIIGVPLSPVIGGPAGALCFVVETGTLLMSDGSNWVPVR